MSFIAHTQKELEDLDLKEDTLYTIKYINKDYFNGEDNVEITKAKVILNDNQYIFVATDPYGMDKFISNARVIL
ncbi:MAG: hypothetical protein WBG69_11675 [Arcobacteraceae bacterium]